MILAIIIIFSIDYFQNFCYSTIVPHLHETLIINLVWEDEDKVLSEDPVKPSLHDGGKRHPVQRELEDDQVSPLQLVMFRLDVSSHTAFLYSEGALCCVFKHFLLLA